MSCCCFALLEENEQLLVTSFAGERTVENGPGCVCVNPCSSSEKRNALILEAGQYCVILNDKHASKRAIVGPCVEWMEAREEVVQNVTLCPQLSQQEYIMVTDITAGTSRNEVGPKLYQPGAYEQMSSKKQVITLSKNEYIRIKDETGKLRVERGEARVVPSPLDTVMGGVQSAVNVDEHHAVLVRNEDTGTLVLYTEHGLFFPSPYQQIVKKQSKIILEEYESMVYKDKTGKFHYVRGDGEMRNFFLPPFCEIVSQEWSTDLRKEHASCEVVTKFDRRPSYMNYEFNCRTIDNVELVVDVSFFWAIIDVKLVLEKTADAPGDACTHARSRIIQEVSKIKLMDFLENFNDAIRAACIGDPFYAERGVDMMSVEVLKFSCASRETDHILQEIIKETADRLKKKERQKGDNEVALSRLGGEIEEEKMRKELIELQKSHLKTEARIEGEAEALKLAAFLERVTGCDTQALSPDQAIEMFLTLRKLDSVQALANGATQLYLTPSDVNLSVGQMFPAVR